eukprot:5001183-Amphidinium_carterae.1
MSLPSPVTDMPDSLGCFNREQSEMQRTLSGPVQSHKALLCLLHERFLRSAATFLLLCTSQLGYYHAMQLAHTPNG